MTTAAAALTLAGSFSIILGYSWLKLSLCGISFEQLCDAIRGHRGSGRAVPAVRRARAAAPVGGEAARRHAVAGRRGNMRVEGSGCRG